jgi:hypothetical protein
VGLRPNAFQICPTVDSPRPDFLAIEALDQCVAFFVVDLRVSVMAFPTCSSVIFRGARLGDPRLGLRIAVDSAPLSTCQPFEELGVLPDQVTQTAATR